MADAEAGRTGERLEPSDVAEVDLEPPPAMAEAGREENPLEPRERDRPGVVDFLRGATEAGVGGATSSPFSHARRRAATLDGLGHRRVCSLLNITASNEIGESEEVQVSKRMQTEESVNMQANV